MNGMDDSLLLERIANALERTADSQAQISSFLLRIAEGQALTIYSLHRMTAALESERLLNFSASSGDDAEHPREW